MDFTEDQIQRYSRHILLQDVGVEGQEKILNGKVLIIGAGGLGAPVAFYLAAAGVGTIGIIDGDVVDLSNLQRQIIHFTADVDKPKVISAKEKINQLNPDVNVITYQKLLNAENALEIINDYDFIVDGTDNFPVKFLINDACVITGKPFHTVEYCGSKARRLRMYRVPPVTVVCFTPHHLPTQFPPVRKPEYWVPLPECWAPFRQLKC